jgi:hypothetical protein
MLEYFWRLDLVQDRQTKAVIMSFGASRADGLVTRATLQT